MRIMPDNQVKTRYGEYRCQDREQAEALVVSLRLMQKERERRRAQTRETVQRLSPPA